MKNKTIIRVLFVDDDTILCKMVKMSLEKNGYEVECLFNLDNIEETIQNMQPNIIVMDIGLRDFIRKILRKDTAGKSRLYTLLN